MGAQGSPWLDHVETPLLLLHPKRNLATVGSPTGPADRVDVLQLRDAFRQAQPLLDHKLMPGMESVHHHHDGIIFPVTVGLVPVLDPASRPHSVAAATTASPTCARAHRPPHPIHVRLSDAAHLRRPCLELLKRALRKVPGSVGQRAYEFVEARAVGHGVIVR